MAKGNDILKKAERLSRSRRDGDDAAIASLSMNALERARWLMTDGRRGAFELKTVVEAMGKPCFRGYDEHAQMMLELAGRGAVEWLVRDAAVDTLVANWRMWPDAREAILAAIDSEEMAWGYRLVLTECCGAEGAQRLVELLRRTRFDETRLRARVQSTILQLADEVDVTQLLDTLYDGLRWDARAAMIKELPVRADLIGWVSGHLGEEFESAVRLATLGWLAKAWSGEPPELESELADALRDPAFSDELCAIVSARLGSLGTRRSLEGLVWAATERAGQARQQARLAIQEIEERLPMDQRISGGLSVSLEPELEGALSAASGAGRGDLGAVGSTNTLVPMGSSAMVASGRDSRTMRLASRWTDLAPAPRRVPRLVRASAAVWSGTWWVPAFWFGLSVLNLLICQAIALGDGEFLAGFFSSFWMYYFGGFLGLIGMLFMAKRPKALKRGDAHLASLVSRDGKSSRWRIEGTRANSEFMLKGRLDDDDHLPVLLGDGTRERMTVRELAWFADVDERGNLVASRSLVHAIVALPVIAISTALLAVVLAVSTL